LNFDVERGPLMEGREDRGIRKSVHSDSAAALILHSKFDVGRLIDLEPQNIGWLIGRTLDRQLELPDTSRASSPWTRGFGRRLFWTDVGNHHQGFAVTREIGPELIPTWLEQDLLSQVARTIQLDRHIIEGGYVVDLVSRVPDFLGLQHDRLSLRRYPLE